MHVNVEIQSLVSFLKKRDPRHKAYLTQQRATLSSSSTLGPSAAAIRAQQRQATASAYVEQEWQKVPSSESVFATAYDEFGGGEAEWAGGAEGEGQEEWECVVCGKGFRSEKAWGNHERSNKHLKEVARSVLSSHSSRNLRFVF